MTAAPNPQDDASRRECRTAQEYGPLQVLAHNVPYALMAALGGAIHLAGFRMSAVGWLAASGYVLYAALGACWIIVFVCPYCQYYATRSCPCGYGQIAAMLQPRARENRFAEKFRKHIPVIVPLWIIPVISGIAFLGTDFRPWVLVLIVAFALDAFVALPLVSRVCGCARCPQKEDCPWMGRKPDGRRT